MITHRLVPDVPDDADQRGPLGVEGGHVAGGRILVEGQLPVLVGRLLRTQLPRDAPPVPGGSLKKNTCFDNF